ncbi:type IV conjugative transfer system protein TraL [Pseudothauera nasutitermitis]|uniref:Type IV conjugative transfer system protein TraL n=1 Tax=Pseudothauera nasutitermitis TaxID=2565930 RepID=A0A4S4AXU1_9RHOO|nr:type IV conjugative transfer system protein TraL [Pseudothauera nasutitermitis]THF64943.1 type IV conjugative transfer system protein TraL [Pseudothauera nasutitermitis]
MRTDTYIPRRLDDNWKLGFWDIDVAAPVLLAFFIGYLAGTKTAFAACLAAGIAVSRWISRLKADKHPAFAIHWLWWHLPATPLTALRATPPSHIRRMVG